MSNKKGRPQLISDELFIQFYQESLSMNDMVFRIVDFCENSQNEILKKWLNGKTEKQLKGYIAMRASLLRKNNVLLINGNGQEEFKRGPSKVDLEQGSIAATEVAH